MSADQLHLQEISIDWDDVDDERAYPFSIPSIAATVDPIGLTTPITFLVGANGSGKSTLLEAIAVHEGLNPEGGSQHMMFETRSDTVSLLHKKLKVMRSGKPRTKFFLRAESYFNVATKLEDYFEDEPKELKKVYGGSPHAWSHGESFINLVKKRFFPGGLFFLDEPEAALSVAGEFELLKLMGMHAESGSQMLVATHSPVLTALPGARILQLNADGVQEVTWDDVEAVQLSRAFLNDPAAHLRSLGL